MASNPSSWGILGNPDASKIEEWKNLPVGDFKRLVKKLSKENRGKKLTPHVVYVTKKVSTLTRGMIKVDAFDTKHANRLAMENSSKICWDDTPYKSGQEELIYSSYDNSRKNHA